MQQESIAQITQQQFFTRIKEKALGNVSWIEQVANVLNISQDAAYRRVRGEKLITLDELLLLSQHFSVSLENMYNTEHGQVVAFNVRTVDEENFTYLQYLQSLVGYMKTIADADSRQVIYYAKDIPIFYNFFSDEIATFKNFVWKKSMIGLKALEHEKFALNLQGNLAELEQGRLIYDYYNRIPSIEFWNEETILSFIRQVDFYYHSGLFKFPKEALILLDKLIELITHIENTAAEGQKHSSKKVSDNESATFDIYINEMLINDNSSLVRINDQRHVFIVHNTINYIHIDNPAYSEASFKWADNILKRSTVISKHSERLRREFFNKLYDKVAEVKGKLS